jgi:hypothetical protein
MQPEAELASSDPLITVRKQPETEVVAAWTAFANGGAAVEDAKIYNRKKAQLIETDGRELPGLEIRVLESQEISAPSTFGNPETSSTSPNPSMLPGGGEKVQVAPMAGSDNPHAVRRLWKDVVSTGDVAPIESLHAIANKAEAAYRPIEEEPSLLD